VTGFFLNNYLVLSALPNDVMCTQSTRCARGAGSQKRLERFWTPIGGPAGITYKDVGYKVGHSLPLLAQTAYSPSMDINARHLFKKKPALEAVFFG
jgi:hypothetical protein